MRFSNVLWGLVFLTFGILIGLNALEITNINIFFKGWWTLFLIIPGLIGLLTEKEKTSNLIILLIGVALLLASLDIINFSLIWKLLVPSILVIIGLSLIFKDVFLNETKKRIRNLNKRELKEYAATFSNQNLDFADEIVNNLSLTSVFGNINCNLKDENIKKETYIKVESIFGGIKIKVPDDVKVKIVSTSIFGGVSNHKEMKNDSKKILYLDATCLFGGVEIK